MRGKIKKRHRVCVEQRLAALGDSQGDIAVVFLTESSMELIKLTASCLLEFELFLQNHFCSQPTRSFGGTESGEQTQEDPGWRNFPAAHPKILRCWGPSPPVNTTRSKGSAWELPGQRRRVCSDFYWFPAP